MPVREHDPRGVLRRFAEQVRRDGGHALAQVTHAARTACPLRSEPLDAAVGEVLGTLSVRVAMTRTRSNGSPSSRAATVSIFVCSP